MLQKKNDFWKKNIVQDFSPNFQHSIFTLLWKLALFPPKKWNLGSLQFDNFLNVSIQATMKISFLFLYPYVSKYVYFKYVNEKLQIINWGSNFFMQ